MDSLLDYDKDFLRPPWGPYGRDLTLGMVSAASKFLMQILNKTRVINLETYVDWVENRPQGVGLLTVSNHTRCAFSAVSHVQQPHVSCPGVVQSLVNPQHVQCHQTEHPRVAAASTWCQHCG